MASDDEYVSVAKAGSIPEGESAAVVVGDKLVALFHEHGKYHAITDVCPHMGASLSEGHCEDGIVTCPWHAWRFDIRDGTWRDNPELRIDCYDVRVVGDDLQLRLQEQS